MAVTNEDLADFYHFAGEKLADGGAESIVELAQRWDDQREHEETIADVREGMADIAAGRVKSVDQAFADIRKKTRPA